MDCGKNKSLSAGADQLPSIAICTMISKGAFE